MRLLDFLAALFGRKCTTVERLSCDCQLYIISYDVIFLIIRIRGMGGVNGETDYTQVEFAAIISWSDYGEQTVMLLHGGGIW